MSNQAFFDSLHAAKARMLAREKAAANLRAPGTDVLRKHIGMVLAEVAELPDGTTAFGFHQIGYPQRVWRWVTIVTGTTANEWIGGHTPTNRRDPAGSRLDPDWEQHQIDVGTEGNERELRDECDP